jgi:hypothetical protein
VFVCVAARSCAVAEFGSFGLVIFPTLFPIFWASLRLWNPFTAPAFVPR